MIHQENLQDDKLYRFELTPNSSVNASESTFNLYGILITPALSGCFLMYNVLQLRDEYFIISLLLLVFILGNIYFFYQQIINRTNVLQLIIYGNYIQLLDQSQIYFQEEIRRIDIEWMKCGKNLHPSIKLSNEDFQGIVIGWTKEDNIFETEIKNKLSHPDYWLKSKRQSKILMSLLRLEKDKCPILNSISSIA